MRISAEVSNIAFDCAAHVISEMNRGRFKSTPIFADKMTIQVILRSAQRLVMLPVTAIFSRHRS